MLHTGEGNVSAILQPDFEMNEDRRPAFTVEGWACAYCASSMSAASQMCLTCGMPRPQGDEKAALRVATPSPKLMAVQKPYDPYEQFYVAAPEASGVIPQEPEFDAPSFGDHIKALGRV